MPLDSVRIILIWALRWISTATQDLFSDSEGPFLLYWPLAHLPPIAITSTSGFCFFSFDFLVEYLHVVWLQASDLTSSNFNFMDCVCLINGPAVDSKIEIHLTCHLYCLQRIKENRPICSLYDNL